MSARRGLDGFTGAFLAYLAIAALLLLALGVRLGEERSEDEESDARRSQLERAEVPAASDPATSDPTGTTAATPAPRDTRPRWRTDRVFAPGRILVAHYGTAGTGALGVLGERRPIEAHPRLVRAARAWGRVATPERPNRPVQPVYELIVAVADPFPGADGDYSHDIDRDAVRRYVDVARRQGALVVLDLQTGREDFLAAAQRWEWALRQPHVGLALDPEWRMARGEVPGRVIGSVSAREVNLTSRWLARMVRQRDLPEKLFLLHQFRTDMIDGIARIRAREGLAMVQHVDGFGTPGQKVDTFRAVAHPRTFHLGFKLFYDEDIRLMSPRAVRSLAVQGSRVRFVSYQ